jgi:hypothetical protein
VPSGIDFLAILRSLAQHEVEFIVVGGISAVLQGAPIATFDLDVVHSRSSEARTTRGDESATAIKL